MKYKGSAIIGKPDNGGWLGVVLFFGSCAIILGAIVVISVLVR